MFFKAKYIIDRKSTPVIFPETLNHAEVAHALNFSQVTGAGFVSVSHDGAYQCYGESVSLKVKSNGEADSEILNRYLGGKQDDDI